MTAALCVTGASGFIGRTVVRTLQSTEHRLVLLQRTPATDPPAPAARTTVVYGDLLEASSWRAALEGVDTVVHLAATTGQAPRERYHRVNVEGTAGLLEASAQAGVRNFLFVSSIAVRFRDAPHYHYAVSKREAEELVRRSGLRHTIVRPTIVLGSDSPIGQRFLSLARLPVTPIFGSGQVRVQPIDVRDAAAVIGAIVTGDRFEGETVEVGGPDIFSLEELFTRLRALVRSSPARIVHLPLAPIRAALGLAERISPVLTPITAGQLALFANDSVAEPHPFVHEHAASFRTTDEMLAGLVTHD
jgi:nucleoside-diphosphate-sugar epimerase